MRQLMIDFSVIFNHALYYQLPAIAKRLKATLDL